MSYSRWSNGTWYAFWSTSSGETKAEQVLCLWADMSQTKDWTYEQLEGFTVEDVGREYVGITLAEAKEGWGYIQEFLQDVNEEFDEHSSQSDI